jgi:hypothetical protein
MNKMSKKCETFTDSQKLTEIQRIVEELLSDGGENVMFRLEDIKTIIRYDGFFEKLKVRITDKLKQKRLLICSECYKDYDPICFF